MAEYGTYVFKIERLQFALQERQKLEGITGRQMATEIGVSHAMISQLKNRKRLGLKVHSLGLICTWLGIPPSNFFDAS